MVTVGNVMIRRPIALAPMAGVTDLAFRTVCRHLGAGYTVTELVSAKALCYQDKKSLPLLKLGEGEHPAAAQIFGSDPVCMGEAAAIAAEASGADIIDINMGCPVPKVAQNGEGAGLMRDPDLAVKVCEAVVRQAGRPVSVKLRLGWDKGSINVVEVAKALEEAGAAMLAVHGRTRAQQYGGVANWDYIRQVKEAVHIPVFANGDVTSPETALRILRVTGADGVMIGRAAMGDPWLFREVAAALEGEPIPPRPPLAQRCETAMEQFRLAARDKGEHIACLEARRHYPCYLRGIPYASYWKEQICRASTLADLEAITKGIQRDLKDPEDES